jgi:hypothetical protein
METEDKDKKCSRRTKSYDETELKTAERYTLGIKKCKMYFYGVMFSDAVLANLHSCDQLLNFFCPIQLVLTVVAKISIKKASSTSTYVL